MFLKPDPLLLSPSCSSYAFIFIFLSLGSVFYVVIFLYEGQHHEKVEDSAALVEHLNPAKFSVYAVLCMSAGDEGAMSLLLYFPRV